MLSQPLIQQLQQLRLRGMAAALEQQLSNGEPAALSFEERLGIMIQHEITERASARLTQRLRWARLPQGAVLEDLNTQAMRGLDPATLAQVRDLAWIGEHLNVLITGPPAWARALWLAHWRTQRAEPITPCASFAYLDSSMSSHACMPCTTAPASSGNWPKSICCYWMILPSRPSQNKPSATCLRFSMIAMTVAPPSSPASYPLISGMPFWPPPRWLTLSSIAWYTTAIGSLSKESRCESTNH